MKVGFVASCFDLFHAGHIMMLKEAKQHCDYLIAGLQTDPTLDRPEKNRPIQSIVERHIQLEACKYIDEIVVYATEKDLLDVLLSFPIDVRIIGEEYKHKSFTGKELPIELCYNKRRHSFSTSELRQRVIDREKAKNESSNNNRSTFRIAE
jgi:glycerol-3-phosphate cytidylyltransferase